MSYVPPFRREDGQTQPGQWVPQGGQQAQVQVQPQGGAPQQPAQQNFQATQQIQQQLQLGGGQQVTVVHQPAPAGQQPQAPAPAAAPQQQQQWQPQQPQQQQPQQQQYQPQQQQGGYQQGGYQGGGGFGSRSQGFANFNNGGFGSSGFRGGGFGHRSQGNAFGAGHHDPNSGFQNRGNAPAAVGGSTHTREDKNMDDLFKDHSAGINFDNYEHIEVSLKPNNISPCETFDDMALPSNLQENIRLCRYTKPTPVQKHGIPVVVQGNDLMACAQTGSGKTAAYLIPAVSHAINRGPQGGTNRTAFPTCLIMAPTRELTIQIYDEGRKFTYRTGLRCVVVYGGADPRQQIYQLQRGCDILAATPGRLWEMHQRGIVKFCNIKYMVLDEADRMLDMGFEPQIRTIVQGPDSDMPATGQRQTLLYSATFPREIQQLAREFLSNHYFLQVGRVGSTTENITQDIRWMEDSEKRKALFEILANNQDRLVLVFVERKRDADYLDRALNQMGIQCTSIHGDRMQREREEALGLFKTGFCKVLVATDVAARGLDIPNVALVVQFDLPSNLDDYVHRIGRTGRAGKSGVAISFFNEKNKNIVNELHEYISEHKQHMPDWLPPLVTRRPQAQGRGRGRGGQGRGRGFHRGGGGFHHNNHHGGGGFRGGHHGGGGGYQGGNNHGGGFQSRNAGGGDHDGGHHRGGYNNNRGGYNNSRYNRDGGNYNQ